MLDTMQFNREHRNLSDVLLFKGIIGVRSPRHPVAVEV